MEELFEIGLGDDDDVGCTRSAHGGDHAESVSNASSARWQQALAALGA
jgi:hypothetical protein